jgi:hypothetical protein
MRRIVNFIPKLKIITLFIYIILLNYYMNDLVYSGFIKRNYIFIIISLILTVVGLFLIDKFFKKLTKILSKKI